MLDALDIESSSSLGVAESQQDLRSRPMSKALAFQVQSPFSNAEDFIPAFGNAALEQLVRSPSILATTNKTPNC